MFFFFKQKTAYEMRISDWIQTCALPICRVPMLRDDRSRESQVVGDRTDAVVVLLTTDGGLSGDCGNSRLKEAHDVSLGNVVGAARLRLVPHIELGKVPQRDHVGKCKKAATSELRDQVPTLQGFPSQEHDDVS